MERRNIKSKHAVELMMRIKAGERWAVRYSCEAEGERFLGEIGWMRFDRSNCNCKAPPLIPEPKPQKHNTSPIPATATPRRGGLY